VRVTRRLCVFDQTLYQSVVFESFAREALDLALTFRFAADFADMFEVRGLVRERRGARLGPQGEPPQVKLSYRGLDGVVRTSSLLFDPAPTLLRADAAQYVMPLSPRERAQVAVAVTGLTRPGRISRPLAFGDALPRRRAPVERLETHATIVRSAH